MAAAVGNRHHQFPFFRSSPSLTSALQGMKRPLGPSAQANQMLSLQQNSLDGYKVSRHPGLLFDLD